MTGVRLRADASDVLAGLGRIDAATGNRRALLAAVGGALVTSAQRRIERETGPDGTAWPRLSPRTAARRIGRRRRGYEHMLRVSNRLYQSLTAAADDDFVLVGSNVVYAGIHQEGGTIDMPERQATIYQHYNARTDTFDPTFRKASRSNFARDVTIGAHQIAIPARPFLGVDADDRAEIAALLDRYFRDQRGAP